MVEIDFIDYISKGEKYYIYGTTSLGMFLYEKITSIYGKESVLGFLETAPIAREYLGKAVASPDKIGKLEQEERIMIASVTHFEDMKSTLLSRDIPEEQIVIPYKIFGYFKTLYGWKGGRIEKVCFWPPIPDDNVGLMKKISWFIPDRIKVSLWCKGEALKASFNTNVCVESIADKNKVFDDSDIIFLWDTGGDKAEYERHSSKVYVVDPEFYFTIETMNYSKLYYSSFSDEEKRKYGEKSKQLFCELRKKYEGCSKARVFCSGPSIEEIYENTYKESLNIICNSMVKDKEWIGRIKPGILAFTDVNYYLSPTEYCRRFFENVLEAQREYDSYIVVYDHEVPLLLAHYPELSGRVIGIKNDAPQFSHPSEKELRVRSGKNILTETMIPLASALCDEIEIAGATGRSPEESFYWKHSGRMQYLDLMHTIFEMYPSLFRDQKYADYYEHHCQFLEGLLEYGEGMGKKYRNLTTSYIPALKRRTVRDLE